VMGRGRGKSGGLYARLCFAASFLRLSVVVVALLITKLRKV